jgi:hypothetical protein
MKLTELTAQLEQESNETIQQARQIERDALNTLAYDLKQQCSSAVTTLKSALDTSKSELTTDIETYKTDLKNALSADSTELTDQLATLKKEVAKWSPKMIWAVKWGVIVPVIATFAACALVLITTWLWMPRELWNIRTSHQSMKDGKIYLVIDDESWGRCNLTPDAGKGHETWRPCKTIGTAGVTLPASSNSQQ